MDRHAVNLGRAKSATVVALLTAAAVVAPAATAGNGASPAAGPSITYVACEDFFGPTAAPATRINLGPGDAPAGRRSLGLVPSGPGTATGPVTWFTSLSTLAARVSVSAGRGTLGAAHLWVTTPDAPAGSAWLGSATVPVPAGGWTSVDARAIEYTWRTVDLRTRSAAPQVEAGRIDEFVARHGDGAGYVVTGFGCDGQPFNIDAVVTSAGSIDFEGLQLQTQIGRAPGSSGATVITGKVVDGSGRVTGDPLQLQRLRPDMTWADEGPVTLADPDGTARTEVDPEGTTTYRWHRPEGQYADEGWSDTVTVEVRPQEGTSP